MVLHHASLLFVAKANRLIKTVMHMCMYTVKPASISDVN